MQPTLPRSRGDIDPQTRRELVALLYTSFPQVAAISLTAVTGALALAVMSGDLTYALASIFIFVTAVTRLCSLRLYGRFAADLSDSDVVRWERIYGIGAACFGASLGMLSFRALQLGDAPGAWLVFGLSMSFCVGMVSRAAIRPWVVLLTAAVLLAPTALGGLMRPEPSYRIGAVMLFLFWATLREASRHLSTAFIERLEAKHALTRLASHDFLTGLPNRIAFLAALRDMADHVAIVAIDLDGFKPVNDRHGHQAGDDLLHQVAQRLNECIGSDGIASRFGGDEFMLLRQVAAGDAGRDAAMALAREAILALSTPFMVADYPVRIGASAGIHVTDSAASSAGTPAALLARADRALYAAKRAGGGQWAWSDQAPDSVRQAG
jgi:diguanylate cyclase (GGDEF)-like protein